MKPPLARKIDLCKLVASLPRKQEEASEALGFLDFSEMVATSNILIIKLGWSNEQCENYLLGEYDKRGRHLLSDDEFRDFINQLNFLVNELNA